MEILDNRDYKNPKEHKTADSRSGGLFIGLAFMAAGLVCYCTIQDGFLSCKTHLTFWQMILVGLGVFLLIRKQIIQGLVILLIRCFSAAQTQISSVFRLGYFVLGFLGNGMACRTDSFGYSDFCPFGHHASGAKPWPGA